MTPLHLAVRANSVNMVAELLSDQRNIQADPNIQNSQGQTPLHLAASNGQLQIIQFLLQSNPDEPCDPTIVDAQHMTAYQLAKANHHDPCAKQLQDYEQNWTRLSPRAVTSSATDPRQPHPASMNPANTMDDEQSSRSVSRSSSGSSGASLGQVIPAMSQQPIRTTGPATAPKPEAKTLADLIRSNPLHAEAAKPPAAKPTSSIMTHLVHSTPLQPVGASPTTKPVPRKFGVD